MQDAILELLPFMDPTVCKQNNELSRYSRGSPALITRSTAAISRELVADHLPRCSENICEVHCTWQL